MTKQTFETKRDAERHGTWVVCSQMHDGKRWALQAFVLDKPDPGEHVAAVVKSTARLSKAVALAVEHTIAGLDHGAFITHWDGVGLWKDREGAPANAVKVTLPETNALQAWDVFVHTARAEQRDVSNVRIDAKSYCNLRADLIQSANVIGEWGGEPMPVPA